MRPVALTIAGSDSGGGAGIQADLRVFSRLGAFGTTAVTALTAQNLAGVTAVGGTSAALLDAQLDAVLGGFAVRAAKCGMLWSAELVAVVARRPDLPPLVVDPVMVATSGARLLDDDAVETYRRSLLPRAALCTPNLDEAAVLLGTTTPAAAELVDAAKALAARLGCPILLKGGHLAGHPEDVLWDGRALSRWRHDRVDGVNTHGSGCMLSAAVTALLAQGRSLHDAVEGALAFVHVALERASELDGGARLAGIEHAECDTSRLRRLDGTGR
jgi:hydroxymethylpyrimidine/phosphomethylpyrimidine kinase